MNVPKVIFKPMSLDDNIELIKWAFSMNDSDLGVHNYTVNYFPELAMIDSNTSKKKINKIIAKVVKNSYEKNENVLIEEIQRYVLLWKEYNDKYLETLINYLGVNFPDSIKEIVVSVGLIPVFPRYLDTFSFSIAPGVEDWKLIETVAHETLHFLWFEKWKNMYPKTPRRHFDSPYLEWKYSEMVTDPILNNRPFNEMFDFTEKGYDSFYELDDNGELVMDKLNDIYAKNDSIENKIKKGYIYITEYFNNETKN